MRRFTSLAAGATLALFVAAAAARGDEEKVPLDKVPKPVLEAAKKRFPKAEVKGASKETENGKTVYEVSLKQDGKNIDATVSPDGTITLIEQEVGFAALPKPVATTLAKKYPGAKYQIIESVTKVEGGKETLEYYEAHIATADKKVIEVEVLPDGKLKGGAEDKEGKKGGK